MITRCRAVGLNRISMPIGMREQLMLARKNEFVEADKALDAAISVLLAYGRPAQPLAIVRPA